MHRLSALLRPTSVAIIGASERRGHGSTALRHLIEAGFEGEVLPVNPNFESLMGRVCYSSVSELPFTPDSAVFAIAADATVRELEVLARRGLKAAVICAGGFAESGPDGRRRQAELARIAGEHGVAICGPNTLGVVNALDHAWQFAGPVAPEVVGSGGCVGLAIQSGSIAIALLQSHRIPIGMAVAVGNQVNTNVTDFLRYMLEDPRITVIAAVVESIANGPDFVELLRDADAAGKPVVLCKPGQTPSGQDAVLAHTGALVDSYEAFMTVCRENNAIVVEDLDDMVELLALLVRYPRDVRTRDVGVINCSGSQNALILDEWGRQGRTLPAWSSASVDGFRAELPDFMQASNPLDTSGSVVYAPDKYGACLRVAANDEQMSTLLLVHDISGREGTESADFSWPLVRQTVTTAQTSPVPVVILTTLSGTVNENIRSCLLSNGVPVLEGVGKGLRALARAIDWTTRPPIARDLAGPRRADPVPEAPVHGDGVIFSEARARELMEPYGLPFVRQIRATSARDAVVAAERLGFPVAIKADAADLIHKARVGGVALGLADVTAVLDAYRSVMKSVAENGFAPTGVLVQRMSPPGPEIIVGMKRDPSFGPMILLGEGGADVEDRGRFTLTSLSYALGRGRQLLVALGERDRGHRWHDSSSWDLEALAATVDAFTSFVRDNASWLDEAELNPVILRPTGQGVLAVDALITGTARA